MRIVSGCPAAPVLLLLIGAAVFAPAWHGVFFFDDQHAIVENPTIRSLGAGTLAPPPQSSVAGRPVVNLTLALNYAVGGLDPRGYHLVNHLLHLANGMLLLLLVRQTLRRRDRPRALDDDHRATANAFAAALLWTVHPLHTETVAYVIQRTELLMAFFYLSTLGAGMCSMACDDRLRRRVWQVLAVIACGLGMGSKEVMVSAPLVMLLYDRTFISGSIGQSLRRRPGFYAALAATWLVLAGLLATGPRTQTVGLGLGVTPWQYLLTQSQVILHYLRLSVVPWPQTINYQWPPVRGLQEAWPSLLSMVMLAGITARALWHNRAAGFLGACFFLVLAPSSSVVPIPVEMAAERRMYLALAPVAILAVTGVRHLLARRSGSGAPAPLGRTSAIVTVAIVAGAFSWLTWQRLHMFRDEQALWEEALRVNPANPAALNGAGALLMQRGQMVQAEQHFRTALRLQPDLETAQTNLGLVLLARGERQAAMVHLHQAIRLRPEDAKAQNNLGVALAQNGDLEAATACFETALHHKPAFATARANLARTLARRGRLRDAAHHYRLAMPMLADQPRLDAMLNLAMIEATLGRTGPAMQQLAAASRLAPHDPRIEAVRERIASAPADRIQLNEERTTEDSPD